MPRRALRKVDPSLDLTRWLRTFETLPQPWNAETLFNRSAPLEVEVGSGKGLFIASASAARPDYNFLGIEIAHKYARHAAAKLARQGRTNAVMVHGDGLRIFRELLPDSTLAAVHVYFPDPWWKARHKKRRVMNEGFLKDVERVLEPSGVLHFWTDVEEYFQSTLELIGVATHLSGPFEVPERAPEHDLDYRTHFERRMRLHGEPVYRTVFRRVALPQPNPAANAKVADAG